jgi:imidazolonepropionase-like amidohydrolase
VNRLISIVVIRGLLILLMLSVLLAEEARAQTEASVERVVALRAGALLEVETGNLIADAVVLIRGERIEAVGPQVRIPPEAEVIDLSDYVVLPGLIDAHTHVCMQPDYAENNPILYKSIPYRTVEAVNAVRATLEAGFTTIRDIDSEGADWADVAVRDGINDGLVPGPRMQVATLAISITGGYMNQNGLAPQIDVPQFGALADSPAALVAEVRRQVKYGTDWIKIYATGTTRNIDPRTMQPLPQFSYEDLKLVVDEAARFRTPVAAHAYGGPGAKNAIRAGVRSIEHGFFLDDEALDMMVANSTFWVPTISVYIPDGPREEWGELRRPCPDHPPRDRERRQDRLRHRRRGAPARRQRHRFRADGRLWDDAAASRPIRYADRRRINADGRPRRHADARCFRRSHRRAHQPPRRRGCARRRALRDERRCGDQAGGREYGRAAVR